MSVQYQYMSPGVYIREDDLSARLSTITSTSGAAVYESLRGPLGPTFYSTGRAFIALNGQPDPTISFAHDCILAFLQQSSTFWGNRVINGALWAGTTYFIDRGSMNAPSDGSGRILHNDFPIGRDTDYTAGSPPFVVLSFAGDLVTGNNFEMDVTDGENLHTINQAFTTDHLTTLAALSQQIGIALENYGSDGVVQVYQEQNSQLVPHLIMIRFPSEASLVFNTPNLTGGASQTAVTLDEQALFIDVMAENPGSWADDVGVQITNVDVGVRQRFRLTIGTAILPGAAFTCNINGRTIGPVPFTTDSDTTLAAIATAIAADQSISSAVVQSVPGATDNDRNISIVTNIAAPNAVAISGYGFSTAAPACLVQETLSGIAPNNTFQINVFERPNINIPAERFTVSMNKQVSADGVQLLIEQQINLTTYRSTRIRVVVPDSARSYVLQPTLFNGSYVIDETINFLAGGDDGAAVLNSQISDGWSVFSNRDRIPATLLINCGYTDPVVQQTMIALAEYRFDAFAVLDMPSDQQLAQDAYNHRQFEMNIDSSYGAIYTPDLLIQDDNSDELRFIPPSGHVAACYAYTDLNAAVWYAPAGLNRGRLALVQGLRVDYDLGDRNLLNPIGVNCIINKVGAGPTIWGEETLQLAKSALSSVHARRLMNVIEVSYADGLDYAALFEPNNSYTQFKVTQLGLQLLQPIKDAGGIYDFAVVCDSRNNTPDTIDEDILCVDVYVSVVRTAKYIILTGILTPTGANFAELISMRSSSSAAGITTSI